MCEKNKTILWITIAIADAVAVLSAPAIRIPGSTHGLAIWERASVLFLKDNYTKLGYQNPADVAMALIYEDRPYGASVKDANFNVANKNKMKVLLLRRAMIIRRKEFLPLSF